MLHNVKMPQLIFMVVIVTLLKGCSAELSTLEKFLTSGFNNKETAETKQDEGKTSEPTSEDIIKFMRRAGLISADDQINSQQRLINSLQALNPQQQSIYLPQQSQLTSYVIPKRQLQVSQQRQQQQLPQAQSSNRLSSDSSTQSKRETASKSQKSSDKGIIKDDRQGLYGHDDAGYSGHHDGYVGAHDAYSSHQDSYSSGHYAHEPVAYHPPPPKAASVAIKLDPIGLLRLLLQGLPKPLLNLNGKLFFGVELGKNAGIVKGVGYVPHAPHAPAPHYAPPAKGIVLNLG